MSAAAAARIEHVEALLARIATLRRELDSLPSVGLTMPFVVVCEQAPLMLDVAPSGAVSNPRPALTPAQATRFTPIDAKNAARLVRNGNNTAAIPVHVRIAQTAAICETQKALLLLINADMPPGAL